MAKSKLGRYLVFNGKSVTTFGSNSMTLEPEGQDGNTYTSITLKIPTGVTKQDA
jgi:hypothetical protein